MPPFGDGEIGVGGWESCASCSELRLLYLIWNNGLCGSITISFGVLPNPFSGRCPGVGGGPPPMGLTAATCDVGLFWWW